MFDLVPTFQNADSLPTPQRNPLPGMLQGVHFTMPAEQREWMLGKIERWFDGRDEIILVSTGETSKGRLGFILLEWEGVVIDPLFLAILQHEEMVEDVTVYNRAAEVE